MPVGTCFSLVGNPAKDEGAVSTILWLSLSRTTPLSSTFLPWRWSPFRTPPSFLTTQSRPTRCILGGGFGKTSHGWLSGSFSCNMVNMALYNLPVCACFNIPLTNNFRVGLTPLHIMVTSHIRYWLQVSCQRPACGTLSNTQLHATLLPPTKTFSLQMVNPDF